MIGEPLSPISYYLPLSDNKVPLNAYLGKTLCLQFLQKINCVGCGIAIKKSYQDGYCFPCTQRLAQTDLCIVKPERCHFHLGTCREPEFGLNHCMVPHVVYLSNASGVKVGIARKTNIPTRWIDQGAISGMVLFEVPTRRVSGLVEVILAKYISDKTNWRKMLTGHDETIDLFQEREKLLAQVKQDLNPILAQFGKDAIIPLVPQQTNLQYPVMAYPQKISSLSFDKTNLVEGTLLGIKGQYLIFDIGVLNIRKHSGYSIQIESP